VPLVYIALGSNLGDRMGQMRRALKLLQDQGAARLLRASPIYQNRAVGMKEDAEDFLNAVAEVKTVLQPMELLDACLAVEEQLGRTRSEGGWSPRTIDLDLLIYEGVRLEEGRLVLPHPRIAERDFVAVPLADLVPTLKIDGLSMGQIVARISKNALTACSERL